MARVCSATGKRVLAGNNVSHANNKLRRRFLPNLQYASFLSETLGVRVHCRLTAYAVRTIEKKGGLDAFLTAASPKSISADLLKVKKAILKRTRTIKTA
ncbi:MAG: 50S ribosomal protein L28 [Holosporales bacterium]|jgi:large subunit ribosomal protein L28|nr:50S ribosomal protein L28 [Holosporales bacterium]